MIYDHKAIVSFCASEYKFNTCCFIRQEKERKKKKKKKNMKNKENAQITDIRFTF